MDTVNIKAADGALEIRRLDEVNKHEGQGWERHGACADVDSGVGARRPPRTVPHSFLHSPRPHSDPRYRDPLPRPLPSLPHVIAGGVDLLSSLK